MGHNELPRAAPARVLALGAFLKNQACLVQGREVWWSPLHGDLGTPEACEALAASAQALLEQAGGGIDAVAHDLHPDFHSTRLAGELAQRLNVPAIAVQHHHAHIAVVQAEQGWSERRVFGLALDGVGLGTDGRAWGGEVLAVEGTQFERLAHLPELPLPGGDAAAREPWRLVAALLHEAGRAADVVPRLAPQVSEALARGVAALLAKKLHCPRTTSAGRWFDAAAGALGLSVRQAHEAEAAVALEAAAGAWLLANGGEPPDTGVPTLDLRALVTSLLDEAEPGRGAARFHFALARGLVAAVPSSKPADVVLGGGCFVNRLLSRGVEEGLAAAGHRVWRPRTVGVGDAGLALGQAWVAALRLAAASGAPTHIPMRTRSRAAAEPALIATPTET
jgi:hydrogenase maturation protein HypF